MSRFPSRTAVVTALLAVVLLAPGRAAASSPCWKQILNDWSAHGSITGTYPIHCYREAYANIPEDVRDYTSLGDDIQSALQAALIGSRAHARHPEAAGSRSLQGREISSLGPSNSDSIPLPLLILAGLATLLLAAGSAGALARKLEARRVPGPPRPRS